MKHLVHIPVLGLLLLCSTSTFAGVERMRLADVKSFAIQIQGLEKRGAVDRLAQSSCDMLVIDSTSWTRGVEGYNMRSVIDQLHAAHKGRIVLAYLDIGAAESDRSYWRKDWSAPGGSKQGNPAFLLSPAIAGWDDTFPVRFWEPAWQDILIKGNKSVLSGLMAAGFDGVFLDCVDIYRNPSVVAASTQSRVDAQQSMIDLVHKVVDQTHLFRRDGLVIMQNAGELLSADKSLAKTIDGVAFEATWFNGEGDVDWDSPKGGDIAVPESPEGRLHWPDFAVAAALPTFTVDYCLSERNAQFVRSEATAHHLIATITRSSRSAIAVTGE